MTKPNTVALYVFDGLADWEIGHAIGHLNRCDGQFLPTRFAVRTFGATMAPVTTMGGLRVSPDATLADLDPETIAMFILPGGPSWDRGGNADAVEAARTLMGAGVPIAAICGATAGLARGGLLDERRHTSNAKVYIEATGYGGAAHYEEALAVTDRNVITAGSTGAVELAAEIFRALELYPPAQIDAWLGLFKTGEARYFGELMAAGR
jgi:putative intracellular protease/amidase